MTKYVIDAHAWMAYFRGEERGIKVRTILEDDANSIFTNVVTLAEISSKISRENMDPSKPIDIILSRSKIFVIDGNFSKQTGIIHAQVKKERNDFSCGDAFVLMTSKILDAKILAGDPDFKGMKNVVFVS